MHRALGILTNALVLTRLVQQTTAARLRVSSNRSAAYPIVQKCRIAVRFLMVLIPRTILVMETTLVNISTEVQTSQLNLHWIDVTRDARREAA